MALPLSRASFLPLLLPLLPLSRADVFLSVRSDGTGQFTSVQAALDSLSPGTNASLGHVTLSLAGVFRERVHIYSNFTGGVDLVGAGTSAPGGYGALVIFNVSGSSGPGTWGSWTMLVDADNVRAANIAIANSADGYDAKLAGQSVALDVQGDRFGLWDGALYGGQDTVYFGRKRTFFQNTYANGTCDSIFGQGSSVWVNARISMQYTVTAHAGNGTTALLFLDSYVESIDDGVGDLLLGRPWSPYAKTVWINTTMTRGVGGPGWDDWGHGCSAAPKVPGTTWCNETFYAEYNTTGSGADPRGRVWWSHQLSETEAAQWTPAALLGDWTPVPPPPPPLQRSSGGVGASSSLSGPHPAARGDLLTVQPPQGSPVCNVLSYGAKGDGRANDTLAIQQALDACAGGGTVVFPVGHTFLSYALVVNNGQNLVVAVEGTLRFANDTRGWNQAYDFCLTFQGGQGIAMTGGGLVDGNGAAWWPAKDGFRPGLVKAQSVTDFLVTNVSFTDSPNHSLELYANNMEIVDTSITASPACDNRVKVPVCAHNTDGIDVHGQPAWIHRTFISTGDDNVAMHANDTLVEDCDFGTGHGTSIGSLGEGTYLKNITVRDCRYNFTSSAVRIKADTTASGLLTGVLYQNLSMVDVLETILVTAYYPNPDPKQNSTMGMVGFTFADIVSRDAVQAGQFLCSPLAPCTGLVLRNVTHTGAAPQQGWQCAYAEGTEVGVTPDMGKCLGGG